MIASEVTARPGRNPYCPPELRSEVHEAGHAIVARVQGIRVINIYVGPKTSGQRPGGRTTTVEPDDSRPHLRRHGIVLAAGEMAALAFGEDPDNARRGAGGDRMALAGILRKLDSRSDSSEAIYDVARHLVEDNLPAIARLANTLGVHSRLGGSEAERAIDAALAGERYRHLDQTGFIGLRRDLFEAAIKGHDLDARPEIVAWLWSRAGWVAQRGGPMPSSAEIAQRGARATSRSAAPAAAESAP